MSEIAGCGISQRQRDVSEIAGCVRDSGMWHLSEIAGCVISQRDIRMWHVGISVSVSVCLSDIAGCGISQRQRDVAYLRDKRNVASMWHVSQLAGCGMPQRQ